MYVAQLGHTTTRVPNGHLVIAGGTAAGETWTAEGYDQAGGSWENIGVLGTARSGHAAVQLGDSVLVGGWAPPARWRRRSCGAPATAGGRRAS
jgi:hypothetical protein